MPKRKPAYTSLSGRKYKRFPKKSVVLSSSSKDFNKMLDKLFKPFAPK